MMPSWSFESSSSARRAQHAAALDAADRADAERDVLAGNERARRREHALHAGARIRRAADDLHRRAVAGVDDADAQPVGVRMLLGGDHAGDGEGGQRLRLVVDVLDLEADHRQLLGELFERLVGVEMIFQPGERELHDTGSGSREDVDEPKALAHQHHVSLNLPTAEIVPMRRAPVGEAAIVFAFVIGERPRRRRGKRR